MFDLTGKKALVTGATGGIGNAIAHALHAQGATVAISGTRREVLEALAEVTIERPVSPLVSNVLAAPISDPDEIRRRLIGQVTGTVRWRESVAYMASHGVTRFFEIGAGKVLSGLVKRITEGAVGISVGGPNDIAAAKDALAAAQTA